MIRHHLAVVLARYRKAPFATAANIVTLALGLASFLAAWGIVDWWRSADAYHAAAARTVVIGQSNTRSGLGASSPVDIWSTATMARHLREDFPEIELLARANYERRPAAAGERKTFLTTAEVDPDFLSIFDFRFVAGDAAEALRPGGAVLTEDAAARLFGEAPALGRSVTVAGVDKVVTGVIAPVRQPSFMGARDDAVLPFDALVRFADEGPDLWTSINGFTFATFPAPPDLGAVNARLERFAAARMPTPDQGFLRERLEAFPLRELTRRAADAVFAQGGAHVTVVGALLALGALTLGIACVNYASLAAAQSLTRAKEVGMRKVLGAGRLRVMAQSWIEAALAVALAAVVAAAGLALAAPAVQAATGIELLRFAARGAAPAGLVLLALLGVALLAGAYPALVLSHVQPAAALRSGRSRGGPGLVARVLVGVQLASASFLLIFLTVMQAQRAHLERAALGPHEDPIVILGDAEAYGVGWEALEAALARAPGVTSVSAAEYPPWSNGWNAFTLSRSPVPAPGQPLVFLDLVAHDYFETLDLGLLAGRVFDRSREAAWTPPDPSRDYPIVLDRLAAARLGFPSPAAAVDQVIYLPGDPAQPLRILGVVEADTMRLASNEARGHMYILSAGAPAMAGYPYHGLYPVVRIARGRVPEATAGIREAWDALAPGVPADVQFYDQRFEAAYSQFGRMSRLTMLLAGAAFAIASLGQLGIAVHVAARRRHEMAVRKTLGSSTLGAARLLLVDFAKPALIANLAAWPAGWLAGQVWLQAFADRAALTLAPFAASLGVTLAIACAAVAGEVWKTASVRPAEALRHA